MFRHELSSFLTRVLDAVARDSRGVAVDADDEPELRDVIRIASEIGERAEDVRNALLGLRAGLCLMEQSVEFAGIEPAVWWTVHPQLAI